MNKKEQITLIEKKLKLDPSTIRAIGIGPLLAQIASREGMDQILKCDADSGDTYQYTGDLEAHLAGKAKGVKRSDSI
jgi:hypothetical protein